MKVLVIMTLLVASTDAGATVGVTSVDPDKPDVNEACTNVTAVMSVAILSPSCVAKFAGLVSKGSPEDHCRSFWEGLKCLAPIVYPTDAEACIAAMKGLVARDKEAILAPVRALGLQLANADFDPNTCDEALRLRCSVTIPECEDTGSSGMCVGQWYYNNTARQCVRGVAGNGFDSIAECNDQCTHHLRCSGPIPECDDTGSCVAQWYYDSTAHQCVRGVSGNGFDTIAECNDQCTHRLRCSAPIVECDDTVSAGSCVGQWFYDSTARECVRGVAGNGFDSIAECNDQCKPDFNVVPGLEVCLDPWSLLSAVQGCIPQMTMDSVTNEHCMLFERTIKCVAANLLPGSDQMNERAQCATYILAMFDRYEDQIPTEMAGLADFDFKQCKERKAVCEDGEDPLDNFDCTSRQCPADFNCVRGHCCPMVRPGVCPVVSGPPICKNQCKMDRDCGHDEKCCERRDCGNNMNKTCVRLEEKQLSPCEEEFREAAKDLLTNGLCGDGKSHFELPRCENGRFAPTQGGLNGWQYCVDEEGNKIPGADFTGVANCMKMRPGRCPAATCNSPITDICKVDTDCDEGEKCCVQTLGNNCVRKCTTAVTVDPTVNIVDDCAERMCCRMDLCDDKKCLADPSAVCRMNSCGTCAAEFFDRSNKKVDCFKGISKCLIEQEEGRRMNADSRSEMEKTKKFIEKRWQTDTDSDEDSDGGSYDGDMKDDMDDRDEYGEERQGSGHMQEDLSRDPIRDDDDDDDDDYDEVKQCFQDKVAGPCKATVIMWYYDHVDMTCKSFDYGCQGNSNRFPSKAECDAACTDREPECKYGEPLKDNTTGHEGWNYNCGLGGRACPGADYTCRIHPADHFAVCCPTEMKETDYVCDIYDRYNVCQNGGHCDLGGDKTTHWHVCSCPDGFYGLFCENAIPQPATCDVPANCLINPCDTAKCPRVPNAVCETNYCGSCHALWKDGNEYVTEKCYDTQCWRDYGNLNTVWHLLEQQNEASKLVHSLLSMFRPPNNMIPVISCDADGNYTPKQMGHFIPLNREHGAVQYCVNPTTGVRVPFTGIAWEAAGETVDCTQKSVVDILSLPRRCSAPIMECDDTGSAAMCVGQWYYDNTARECVRGVAGNGFDSIAECYDQCQYSPKPKEPRCPPVPADMMGTCDENCPDCASNGQLCCSNGCGHVCKDPVTIPVEPKPCDGLDCDYSHQFCDVSLETTGGIIAECADFQRHCLLEPDEGYGERSVGVYYFHAASRTCRKFEYTGMGGNANRFSSLHQCHTECALKDYKFNDVVCPRPSSLLYDFDMKVLSNMCDRDADCKENDVCCSNGHALVCTGSVASCSNGYRCSFYGWCEDDMCVCPNCTGGADNKVCGSDGKTYDNECELKMHACRMMQRVMKSSDGECTAPGPVDPADCLASIACTEQYEPLCAYDTTLTTVPNAFVATSFGNECLYKKHLKCNTIDPMEMPILYRGECNRECGTSQCQLYETCNKDENGEETCGCPEFCPAVYSPVCGHALNADHEAATFSNICGMRRTACEQQEIYVIKHQGPCKEKTDKEKYECPAVEVEPSAISVESMCDPDTNARCDGVSEWCCPYGQGHKCVLKRDLKPKITIKDGICPIVSALTFDASQCQASACDQDGDCDGRAKCCGNDACGYMTCTPPIETDMICGAGRRMLHGVTCQADDPDSCPTPATCETVMSKEQAVKVDVCCVDNDKHNQVTNESMNTTRICNHMKMLGLGCQNGGRCVANLQEAIMCECPEDSFGLFCGGEKPKLNPDGTCKVSMFNCFIDPCDPSLEPTCPMYPDATCTSNYCGGCHAIWTTRNGEDVTKMCRASHCIRQKDLSERIGGRISRGDVDDTPDRKKRSVAKKPSGLVRGGAGNDAGNDDKDNELIQWLSGGSKGDSGDHDDKGDDDQRVLTSHNPQMGGDGKGSASRCITEDPNVMSLTHMLKDMGFGQFLHDVECDHNGDFGPRQCMVSVDDCATMRCGCADKNGKVHGATKMDRKDLRCDGIHTDMPKFCLMRPSNATCSETDMSTRYYFDVAESDCVAYTDGGCGRSENSFHDKDTCLAVCISPDLHKAECDKKNCASGTSCRFQDGQATCVEPKQPGEQGHFEPRCDDKHEFEHRQCHGEMCFCVRPDTGAMVPDSLDTGGNLRCNQDASGNVHPDFAGKQRRPPVCPDNTEAKLCKNGGDRCKNCAKSGGGSQGQTGSGQGDRSTCECESCPNGQHLQKCSEKCTPNSCKNFPEASCRVDKCSCQKVYTDVAGNPIDCTKIHSQCVRTKATNEKERKAMDAVGVVNEPVTIECNNKGGFKWACQGGSCWCLNASSGVSVDNNRMTDQAINCDSTQRKSVVVKARIQLRLSTKPLSHFSMASRESMKSQLKVNIERTTDLTVITITLYEGSVMAEVTVEAATDDADITSNIVAWNTEVNDGNVEISVTEEDMVVSEPTTAELLTAEEPEITETDDDDDTTTIIIVVVVVGAIALACIIVGVACYVKAKSRSKKERDIHFDDLHGQTNPTYSKH